ncbi:MAG: hypothetical protein U0517_03005 [Candidatus Andersenbacteria bacterium]
MFSVERGPSPYELGLPAESPKQEKTQLDKELYDRVQPYLGVEVISSIENTPQKIASQREAFLKGEIESPELDYPKLTPEKLTQLQQQEDTLLSLKKELQLNEKDIGRKMADLWKKETRQDPELVMRMAYLWRINESIASIRMLRATAEGKSRRFMRYSEYVFGKPDKDMFFATVNGVRQEAEKARELHPDNPEVQKMADEFFALLPSESQSETQFLYPPKETIDYYEKVNRTQFKETIETIEQKYGVEKTKLPRNKQHPEQLDLTSEQVAQEFESALKTISLDKVGWKVVIDPNRKGYAVSQDKKEVYVPEQASDPVKINDLVPYVLHEVITHPLRRERGERSRLRLLGVAGLDRYIRGEEGGAIAAEQAYEGRVDFGIPSGHLGVGMALGIDGKPRNFRELFEINKRYATLRRISQGMEIRKATEMGTNVGWDNTVRTFRGTDGKTPGAVFTRDYIYREGNMAIWQLIGKKPEEAHRFNLGKFDPTNERHVWVLDQLEITDTDLKDLEKD